MVNKGPFLTFWVIHVETELPNGVSSTMHNNHVYTSKGDAIKDLDEMGQNSNQYIEVLEVSCKGFKRISYK